jgi:plastocyanin
MTWTNLIRFYALTYLLGGLLMLGVMAGSQRLPWHARFGYTPAADPVVTQVEKAGLKILILNLDFKDESGESLNNQTLIARAGMEVRWINVDPLIASKGEKALMPHMIRITDSREKVSEVSPMLNREQNTYTHTFSAGGTYTFSCLIHPFLQGKVRVIHHGT